ncbi:Fur family transcriptional regulator [Pseudofulvibacter geojedonensis]|uniref:Fur family transcriptional regulator n=1 Tax=Pseudofulvibacter geojedonensis TaxID=1123758 RepID=A0ABW3I0F6_9FLAO
MGVIRKTKSVQTLLTIFENNSQAISVVNLINQLSEEMNKTTIYRILDRLENDGVVHSFLGKEGLKWYAKCHGCSSANHIDLHPHFQCQECGKVECVSMNVSIPTIPNKKINSSQLLLVGMCENCG